MDDYKEFLRNTRKSNGEKYLPKTIEIYDFYIENHKAEWESCDDYDCMISVMNEILSRKPHNNVRSAFKTYLQFKGLDDDDVRLKSLRIRRGGTSALKSQRELSLKVLTREELQRLYNNLDNDWKLIVGFLYDTACRESEMLGVTTSDIYELDNPSDNMACKVMVHGKGSKRRQVYLSSDTKSLLDRHMQTNDLRLGTSDKVFEFKKSDGKPYSRPEKYLIDNVRKLSKKILGKAITPHCLRHGKLTHLADDGADVYAISRYAGHSDVSQSQVYIKFSKHAAEKAYERHSKSISDGGSR